MLHTKLRSEYQACLKLAGETDSKKEDEFLRSEAKRLLGELKYCCPHYEVVCTRSEYSGSHCMDYDDSHPETRLCLCCGVEENSSPRFQERFKILTLRPFARFEGNLPPEISKPLEYLLAESVQTAESKGYHYFDR